MGFCAISAENPMVLLNYYKHHGSMAWCHYDGAKLQIILLVCKSFNVLILVYSQE